MKLTYHTGKNFGDALNPFIFKSLLPNFFDNDATDLFLGIGSILGLKEPGQHVKRVIVFSSGIGGNDKSTYGAPPSKKLLKKYDFRCVRGPLTAKIFNLPKKCIVCDGAILLSEVLQKNTTTKKKFKYSYMPHVGTLKYFPNWKHLMNSLGINFINPTKDIHLIIDEIRSSEVLFSEAMHGAIVADTLRIPWIPIKSKESINDFKWRDYCLSLDLEYNPYRVSTLYDHDFMNGIIANKIGGNSNFFTNMISKSYIYFQDLHVEKKVLKQFKQLKNIDPLLSDSKLLDTKIDQLLDILYKTSKDYR